MAWTTPKTWTNAAVTATEFNTHIRDNLNWLKGAFTQLNVTSDSAKAKITPALVGARVYKAAAQGITTGVSTAIQFDTERFDSDAFHDNVTNNTRLTIPASMGGYYVFGAHIQFNASATGYRQVAIVVNATTSLAVATTPAISGVDLNMSVAALYQLAATDYIETYVLQTNGSSINVNAATNYSPEMWIHRMSST